MSFSLLNKIEDNDKGLDITLYGTAVLLVTFVAFCSLFDFWIITYGKEQVIQQVEMYEVFALCKAIDYNEVGYHSNFKEYFHASKDDTECLEIFEKLFKQNLYSHNGFIKKIRFASDEYGGDKYEERLCYCNEVTKKIVLDSGDISFELNKIIKAKNGNIPFFGGGTDSSIDDRVFSRVKTAVRLLTKY